MAVAKELFKNSIFDMIELVMYFMIGGHFEILSNC